MFSCFIVQLSSYICPHTILCKAFFLLAALPLTRCYLLEVSTFRFTSNKTVARQRTQRFSRKTQIYTLYQEMPLKETLQTHSKYLQTNNQVTPARRVTVNKEYPSCTGGAAAGVLVRGIERCKVSRSSCSECDGFVSNAFHYIQNWAELWRQHNWAKLGLT